MCELRRVALECASRLAPAGEQALSTVARAEIFLNWLEQRVRDPLHDDVDLQAKVDALDRVIASAGRPPPLPSSEAFGRISNHDFGQADQSPARIGITSDGKGFTIIGGDPNVYEIDPDDMKTRIVRPPVDAA